MKTMMARTMIPMATPAGAANLFISAPR
jgi:hypothetical protein